MKIILIIILVIVVAVLVFAAYLGAFASVSVQERDTGPYTLVYREADGNDMKAVGEITTSLDDLLTEKGVAQRRPLDIFFPDGHAEIGFAVTNASPQQLEALAVQAKLKQIPVQRCMTVEFPWRSKLSFMVGYLKVNPALETYRAAHGYKKVEAYALNTGDTIVYMQPIAK